MQVHKIGSDMTFGKIILDCKDPIPASLLFSAEKKLNEVKGVSINPLQFLGDNLLPKVIESDYNTPRLQKRYQELVKSQEDNPHDIHLDLYLADEGEIPLYPEGWYQRATVGDKIFPQRIYEHQGSAIKFLEDACQYANKLWSKNVDPEKTAAKTAINVEQEVPRKTTFRDILFVIQEAIKSLSQVN